MKKENSGITLLALIITIIIMLILAGVTISIVGGSDGIVAKAEKAVSQTDKAAQQEDAELSIAAIKMDYYEDYAANRAKYANAKAFIVDYLKNEYKTSRGATMVADSEENVTYTYKGVATTLSLGEDGSVILGESSAGGTITPDVPEEPETPIIPTGLAVGDTVSYSPSGTYTWQSKYYASADTVDGKTYSDVQLDSGASGYQITSWKVFSIDESTGKVELVPSVPTTGEVTLHGAQGYNNGVKLLNDACSNLYGNSSKGILARSINIDDIESVMYYEAMDFVEYYKTYGDRESYLDENFQITSAYTTVNSTYPSIYEQEDLSVITYAGETSETKVNIGTGLGRSEQTNFIERTATGVESGVTSAEGKITTAATSIRPYKTYYNIRSSGNPSLSELLGDYASLVLGAESSARYWVASRCVNAHSDSCLFGVRLVYGGDFGNYWMFDSDGDHSGGSEPLFPVVSLSAGILSEGTTTDWEVK